MPEPSAATDYQRVTVTLVVVGDRDEAQRVSDAISDLALMDDAVQSFGSSFEPVNGDA